MRSLYVTTAKPSEGSGGGVVALHEIKALNPSLTVSINEQSPFLNDYFCLWKIRNESPFELAHFYGAPFGLTADYLKKQGTRILATVSAHNLELSVEEHIKLYGQYPYNHMTDPYLWSIYSHHIKIADTVICPSKTSAEYVKQHLSLEKDPTVIRHGCNIPKEPAPLPETFTVGYLGQCGPDKGVIYLVQAWNSLKLPNARIFIAGQGTEQLGGAGYIPDEKVLHNSISVYVQPSVTEGYGIPCLTPNTSIITYSGLKRIDEIVIGDLVLTHTGTFHLVEQIMSRHYEGDLVSLRAFKYHEPILITPDHPVLAIKRPRRKYRIGYEWEKEVPNWIPASDIRVGDCLLSPIPKQVVTGQNIQVAPALGELMGWYIAEGCPAAGRRRDGIVFSLNKKETDVAQRISEIMSELFDLKTSYETSSTRSVRWVKGYSAILGVLFPSLAGVGSHNKRIPRAVLYGDISVLKETIMAITRGDGGKKTEKKPNLTAITTVSKDLAFDLYFGLLRIGQKPRIGYQPERNSYEITWSISPLRAVGNRSWLLDGFMACLVKDVKSVPYKGLVHNLLVQEDSSYVANVFAVHNCIDAMANGRPVIVTEGAGSHEIVEDGKEGFVVQIRNPLAIAEKIRFFFENPDEIVRMGRNARVKSEQFSWDKIEKEYESLISEVC